MKSVTLIILLQFNVPMGYFGSWHLSGCHLRHTTQTCLNKFGPWRPRCGLDLALTPRSMDTGPLGYPMVSDSRVLTVNPLSPWVCKLGCSQIRLVPEHMLVHTNARTQGFPSEHCFVKRFSMLFTSPVSPFNAEANQWIYIHAASSGVNIFFSCNVGIYGTACGI